MNDAKCKPQNAKAPCSREQARARLRARAACDAPPGTTNHADSAGFTGSSPRDLISTTEAFPNTG
eukprot:scaffold76630_cov72-Phaeocystis_antarctica.AAC.1